MSSLEQFLTTAKDAGKRLDLYLAEQCPNLSRSQLKTAIKNGQCSLNGHLLSKPDFKLTANQTIILQLTTEPSKLKAETGPVEIIYQDSELVVLNKQAGLTVHPCPSCPENTLVQRLISLFPNLANLEGLRPGIVHRLDKDTSGLLAIALTEEARLFLTQAFAQRIVHKEYLALVYGNPPMQGECQEPIGRHPVSKTKQCILAEKQGGKRAYTSFEKLLQGKDAALLKVQIQTGRTHQIRVHLSHLGYPLLGDNLYAPLKPKALAPRQMLHAFKLTLPHPQTKEPLEFICPPPPDFINVLKTQLREVTCCIITGNPGSGKSQLTQFLADQGYLTCSADALVTKLYAPKGEVAKWLNLIAKDCVDENLEIERDRLMAKLKADSLFKRDFEAMIHAQVYAELEAFWQQPSSPNFTFAEVPLWFECGWHKKKSFPTICVYTPQDLRFKRLAENRGWSSEKAALLESWQWPETQKAKASTYIVDNSHSLEELKLKAQKLLQQLEEEYLKKKEASYAQLTCLLHLNSKPT